MNSPRLHRLILTCLLLGCCSRILIPNAAATLVISRVTSNLPDIIVGEDLWSAAFSLSGDIPTLDQGFTVYFDASTYRNLTGSFAAAANDWDVLLIQPDDILTAPGFLDALSLVVQPSFKGAFTVNFQFLGNGTPGAQSFEVYSLANGFTIVESGSVSTGSVNSVPEGSVAGYDVAAVVAVLGLAISRGLVRPLRRRSIAFNR
jgi:hypothetical protein